MCTLTIQALHSYHFVSNQKCPLFKMSVLTNKKYRKDKKGMKLNSTLNCMFSDTGFVHTVYYLQTNNV